MTRVKSGVTTKQRHKKVLKAAKGYFGSKHRLYKTAKEQLMHSGAYAYRDRRANKRNFRKLWITRINAACRENCISYSKFINGLNKAGIEVNRKMLSEIAIADAATFTSFVKIANDALNGVLPKEKKAPKVETKAEEKIETEVTNNEDLSKLTVAALKEMAKERGIEGYTTMKKDELINSLK